MKEMLFNVDGMSCDHCVDTLSTALDGVAGVSGRLVSLAEGTEVPAGTVRVQLVEVSFGENWFSVGYVGETEDGNSKYCRAALDDPSLDHFTGNHPDLVSVVNALYAYRAGRQESP